MEFRVWGFRGLRQVSGFRLQGLRFRVKFCQNPQMPFKKPLRSLMGVVRLSEMIGSLGVSVVGLVLWAFELFSCGEDQGTLHVSSQ